jgi:hypothetical protein
MLFTLAAVITYPAQARPQSAQRLALPLEQRLDVPLRVSSATLKLTEFAAFVATSFKVPLLVESPLAVEGLKSPKGTYSARQLLNVVVRQRPELDWEDVGGVAHIFDKRLVRSRGNLLNVRIRWFAYSKDVGETLYMFRACVSATIKGFGCETSVNAGFALPHLQDGALPKGQTFENASVREILLTALKQNGRFWILIGFDGHVPKLESEFPFLHWYNESLEVNEAPILWR